MIRAIPCPPEVPLNFSEIIVVFAEFNAKNGRTGTMIHFSESLLENLRAMSIGERFRLIKLLCSNIQDHLLQSSSNPTEVNIRDIGGNKTC